MVANSVPDRATRVGHPNLNSTPLRPVFVANTARPRAPPWPAAPYPARNSGVPIRQFDVEFDLAWSAKASRFCGAATRGVWHGSRYSGAARGDRGFSIMNEIGAPEDLTQARALQSDREFDSCLPNRARSRADRYWTPLAVASRAAQLFRQHGASSVLDVGCGPGKFCIAAACAEPELHWQGVEQRATLVQTARRLTRRLGVRNAHFSAADALDISWDPFDGFYFFNPFAENVYGDKCRYDGTVVLSARRFASDLIQIEKRLAATRAGTVLVTYHGLGGPIPSSFDPIHTEPAGTDRLRTWLKRPGPAENWSWIDHHDEAQRVPQRDVHEALLELAREDEG